MDPTLNVVGQPNEATIRDLDHAAILRRIEEAKGSGDHGITVAQLEDRLSDGDGGSPELSCAMGLLLREQGRLESAADWLEQSIRQTTARSRSIAGAAAIYLSSVCCQLGRFAEAEAHLRAARDIAEPHLLPTLELNWGFLFERSERLEEAIVAYERSAAAAMAAGDEHVWSVSINNRALTLMSLGRLAEAEVDLRMLVARSETSTRVAAVGQHNLGQLLGRRGAIREGLERIDRASEALAELHLDRRQAVVAEVEILIEARLHDEALGVALTALDSLAHDAVVVGVSRSPVPDRSYRCCPGSTERWGGVVPPRRGGVRGSGS